MREVPDHGESSDLENLCLEHRISCRGKDYLDEPCVCAILQWGYDLGWRDAQSSTETPESYHSITPIRGDEEIRAMRAYKAQRSTETPRDEKGRTPAEAKFIQDTYGVDGYPVRLTEAPRTPCTYDPAIGECAGSCRHCEGWYG